MTYAELIEQTKKFQAEALDIARRREEGITQQDIISLAAELGEFAEAIEHCRIAAS